MEECISIFDMLKIGVGPSSSHTLGPWRAAERFLNELKNNDLFQKTNRIQVNLYGSLSLTGKGHATDFAIMLGLSGQNPEYIPIENLKPGNLVKTVSSGLKKIEAIGYARVYYDIKNNGRTKNNLYTLCKTEYPELFEDLVITGCHSILVDKFLNEEQRNKTIEVNGNTYLTPLGTFFISIIKIIFLRTDIG